MKIYGLILFLASSLSLSAASNGKPIVSILGDSYSTFESYIPDGNATWYTPVLKIERTDVDDVRQTWWWQLISEGGYILGINESYSGATVSYTGYNGKDYSDRSFITRLKNICASDILFIFGATNDDWAGAPMGEFCYDKLTRGHLFEFRPALGKLLKEAQNRLPGTRIIYVINSDLREDVTSSIVEVCRHFGVEYVQLKDIDKKSKHPSKKGMIQIKDQLLNYLKK